ncbi:hypothetical protein [Burkholderia sp. Ax-1724]|uniref:hypothetical protein n=1 Tax=Burkholderia sp. Ax-1724 TaxID=2608336 RepID=UPI001421FC46|nr:hypothetical protein [Burkholderia sp. Ax-1724]NIF52597.1 hypothetical protein [Burkholderia sp. Ax-1724]
MARLGKVVEKRSAQIEVDSTQAEQLKKKLKRAPTAGTRWSFSFTFFREIEKFGLSAGDVPQTWLLSVLERFKELGSQEVDEILSDHVKRDYYRFHPIDWNARNIPVKRKELDWIAEDYRDNEEEFPLAQFMVSMGRGRIIGFFDEKNVFQVVLLDPLHNMQPSSRFHYLVDPCSPLGCEFTRLHNSISDVVRKADHSCGCGVASAVGTLLKDNGSLEKYSVLPIRIDDPSIIDEAEEMVSSGAAESYADIFLEGLCSVVSRAPNAPPQPPADAPSPADVQP